MRNPMTTPLWGTAMEPGYPSETFDFPATVTLDSVSNPDLTGTEGGVSLYRGNTGEIFQDHAPEYAGIYELAYQNVGGLDPYTPAPTTAPGSVDLIMPRDSGGVVGTNRLITSTGPVNGAIEDQWSGNRADLHSPEIGQLGPVAGGPDYSQQLGAAYWQSVNAAFSEANAAADMVAAV